MATTKIWDVKAHVSKLLAYVANKNKTTMELEVKSDNEAENLAAEILGLPPEHFLHEEKKFVTGINCTPENANEVMLTLWKVRRRPRYNAITDTNPSSPVR